MKESFRCPICGGNLVFTDKKNGLVKCESCGNRTQLDIKILPEVADELKCEKIIEILDNIPRNSVKNEENVKLSNTIKLLNVSLALLAFLLSASCTVFIILSVFLVIDVNSTKLLVIICVNFLLSIMSFGAARNKAKLYSVAITTKAVQFLIYSLIEYVFWVLYISKCVILL